MPQLESIEDDDYDDTIYRMRNLVLDVAPVVRIVESDDFVDAFLPSLPDRVRVKTICEAVEKKGGSNTLENIDDIGNTKDETQALRQLSELLHAVLTAASNESSLSPTFEFAFNKYRGTSKSSLHHDGHLFKTGTDSESYFNIPLVLASRPAHGPSRIKDSYTEVVYVMQLIMSIDFSRRFTFGITVEGADMRVWYTNRAVLTCTTPINIVKKRELFTQIILSFAFAQDTEMGWDPTVESFSDSDGKRQYRITVAGEVFTTVKELSVSGADDMVGRGRRVYLVKGADSELKVLKDVWLEEGRETEADIYKAIVADLRAQFPERAEEVLEKHILTPIKDCAVHVHGQVDHTKTLLMRGRNIDLGDTPHILIEGSRSPCCQNSDSDEPSSESEAVLNAVLWPSAEKETVKHRRHLRILFAQYATPIDRLTDFSHVLRAVADTLKVLELLHDCGWLHRDISIGNIYYLDGRGLLGDFEYAKRIDDDTAHDVRRGTLEFMSDEAQNLRYRYRPRTKIDEDLLNLSVDKLKAWSKKTRTKVPFRHNSLHDLESVWWVLVWILFYNRIKDATESKEEARARRKMTADLFPGFIGLGMRQDCFESPHDIYRAFETLVWCRDDELIDDFSANLAIVAQRLVKAYTAFEAVLWPAYADFLAGTGVQSSAMFYKKYQPDHSTPNECLRKCVEKTFVDISNQDYKMEVVKTR